MIPSIRYEDCWFVGDTGGAHLMCRRTAALLPIKFKEEDPECALDLPDSGGVDLHVIFHGFVGEARILEFLNRCIAERFDLPTRIVTVHFGNMLEGVTQCEGKPPSDACQVLISTDPVHCVIPRSVWIEYRAKHAAEMVRREECWRSPAPQEKGGE